MSIRVQGLHHVTSVCSDANIYDRLWSRLPGMARVKITVNFDNPRQYHLYYGRDGGLPGTIMTYFPTPDLPRARRGTGEVAITRLRVGEGAIDDIAARFAAIERHDWGAGVVAPDGDLFDLVAETGDGGVLGLAGVVLGLADTGATAELLAEMGYAPEGSNRFSMRGNGADTVDLRSIPDAPRAGGGAGSVHHVAFAVADIAALEAARGQLTEMGMNVTGVRDRSYFRSIYFREPGGVLFEFATNDPGFAVDEDEDALGRALCLPPMHAHARPEIEAALPPLDAVSGA